MRVGENFETGGINATLYSRLGTGMLTAATLAPDSTQDISLESALSRLPLPLPFCSIRIQYTGAPGSMVADVMSVDSTNRLVVDAMVQNEGNGWAGSGANPWHLDKNTESILFLTNESDKQARIGFSITANGVRYFLTKLKLQPHETRAINIRELRDAQLVDLKKNTIPAAATDGSVTWVRLDNLPVNGRLMVISRHGHRAATYNCGDCCCPASYVGWADSVSPTSVTMQAGDVESLTYNASYEDCNGNIDAFDESANALWNTSNSSVATVDQSGDVTAVAGGNTSISGSYTDLSFLDDQDCSCNGEPGPSGSGSASVTVNCGDDRDQIIPQYQTYPTSPVFTPTCSDFTNSGGTANFTFAELNVNQSYAWAILQSVFLTGLQDTRSLYGLAMTVNSGYREPVYNHSISPTHPSSQHVFGKAADIGSNSTTWQSLHDAAKANGACVEPVSLQGGSYAHVHIDWRGTCPNSTW